MKILHTADWHIGQLFYDHDRSFEHQQFLEWLVKTLKEEAIDVLLISGDVFDQSNPSAVAQRMFYRFLGEVSGIMPALQIIITAGNHDSAARLESPLPLLERSNIHIVGTVDKLSSGQYDFDKLLIPIRNGQDTIGWCMAVPFLRMGDYPQVSDCTNPYEQGVTQFYSDLLKEAMARREANAPIIAMGHLHARSAELSDHDKTERLIMGGVECIGTNAFAKEIKYVALGHIHKAQRLGGKEHIRYCGSPLPMSFSEINYKHQVVVFELEKDDVSNIRMIEIPISVSLIQVPRKHKPLAEALSELAMLPETDSETAYPPYLEVRVLADGPEPARRQKIEAAIAGKNVRLARIDVKYPATDNVQASEGKLFDIEKLYTLQPLQLLEKVYLSRYQMDLPEDLLVLFNETSNQVGQKEL